MYQRKIMFILGLVTLMPFGSSKAYVYLKYASRPVVSEKEYVCAIGALYNLSCDQIWDAHKPYESVFQENRNIPVSDDAPYLIEAKTHRLWLTPPDAPKEVAEDRLQFYNQSLQFYAGKPYEHHFWCNGKHLIPQTIATIEKFNIPGVIHEIEEVLDRFITKNLFRIFLNDKRLSKAGDLARQEILLQYGGLYADIGLEQLHDLEAYFKKYTWIQFMWLDRPNCSYRLGSSALGAQKGSQLLRKSLRFIRELSNVVSRIRLKMESGEGASMLITWHAWRLFWALEEAPKSSLGFVYKNIDFDYHGFSSWHWEMDTFSVDYYREVFKLHPEL